jgi:hypothetical protein
MVYEINLGGRRETYTSSVRAGAVAAALAGQKVFIGTNNPAALIIDWKLGSDLKLTIVDDGLFIERKTMDEIQNPAPAPGLTGNSGIQAGQRMITPEQQVENWFTYHSPTPDQLPKYQAIRDAGKALALAIVANCPASADRTAAIRLIREAVMTANASIACAGQ